MIIIIVYRNTSSVTLHGRCPETTLGEMIGELLLKSAGTRVLDSKENTVIEESFHGSGKILGIEVTDTRSVIVEGLQGEGQGIVMTKDGEMATNTRHGVGWPNEHGGHTVRAAIVFKTTS